MSGLLLHRSQPGHVLDLHKVIFAIATGTSICSWGERSTTRGLGPFAVWFDNNLIDRLRCRLENVIDVSKADIRYNDQRLYKVTYWSTCN